MLKFKLTVHDWEMKQERTITGLPLAKAWRIAEHYRRRALRQYDYKAPSHFANWGWTVGDIATGKYCSATIRCA